MFLLFIYLLPGFLSDRLSKVENTEESISQQRVKLMERHAGQTEKIFKKHTEAHTVGKYTVSYPGTLVFHKAL